MISSITCQDELKSRMQSLTNESEATQKRMVAEKEQLLKEVNIFERINLCLCQYNDFSKASKRFRFECTLSVKHLLALKERYNYLYMYVSC